MISPQPHEKRTIAIGIISGFLLLILVAAYNNRSFFIQKYDELYSSFSWEDLGPVPHAADLYPPQGMTFVNDTMILSNHWKDTKSQLYAYNITNMEIIAEAEMPKEATHIGGLEWDGQYLWAVDTTHGTLYKLDYEKTFLTGKAFVLESYPTIGVGAPSGITFIDIDDVKYLVITTFLKNRRTYIIRYGDIPKMKTESVEPLSVVAYKNEILSQGAAWDGYYLYEGVNNVDGVDKVIVYDVKDAVLNSDSNRVTKIGLFNAPANGIEDLAMHGNDLWVADEKSYRIYKMNTDNILLTVLEEDTLNENLTISDYDNLTESEILLINEAP